MESPTGRHTPVEAGPRPTPPVTGAFLLVHWRRLVVVLAAVIALVVQAVLMWMAYELLDLVLSLMEVWAELARKHLEIILS